MMYDTIREKAIVARALRLHQLLNKLGSFGLAGDCLDDASVEHMALVAEDRLTQSLKEADCEHDEEDVEWFMGNVNYVALEIAIQEAAHAFPDDLSDFVIDNACSWGWKCAVDQGRKLLLEDYKDWLRSEEGQQWINEETL